MDLQGRAMKGIIRTHLDRIHTGARKAWNASLTTTQTPADAAKPRHVHRATCAAARLRVTEMAPSAALKVSLPAACRLRATRAVRSLRCAAVKRIRLRSYCRS